MEWLALIRDSEGGHRSPHRAMKLPRPPWASKTSLGPVYLTLPHRVVIEKLRAERKHQIPSFGGSSDYLPEKPGILDSQPLPVSWPWACLFFQRNHESCNPLYLPRSHCVPFQARGTTCQEARNTALLAEPGQDHLGKQRAGKGKQNEGGRRNLARDARLEM